MHIKLEMVQDKFMESIGKLAEGVGVNPFIAQLYAALYLSSKPLSLDDLVERLKASKGNISLNIRELEKWGAVKNIWVKGSRKDYYEADPDIKKIVMSKLKSGVQKRIGQVSDMMDEFKALINVPDNDMSEEDKKMVKVYIEKLKKIEDMKNLASKALHIAEKLF
jgi:DNA-binding transcriptional regulator GbsR (MarR family)